MKEIGTEGKIEDDDSLKNFERILATNVRMRKIRRKFIIMQAKSHLSASKLAFNA